MIPEDNHDENDDNAFEKAEAFVERYRCTVIFVDIVLCCDEDAKSPHNLQNYLHVVLA